GTQGLGAGIAIGAVAVGRASGQAYRQQRHQQGEAVGGHVRGIGQQRQAAADQGADHLRDQEAEGQQQGPAQRPLVPPGIEVMVVALAHTPSLASAGYQLKTKPTTSARSPVKRTVHSTIWRVSEVRPGSMVMGAVRNFSPLGASFMLAARAAGSSSYGLPSGRDSAATRRASAATPPGPLPAPVPPSPPQAARPRQIRPSGSARLMSIPPLLCFRRPGPCLVGG